MIIRKISLRESDNDFIEINGMKLPKDYVMNVLNKAKDMGFDSPETVSNSNTTTANNPNTTEFKATKEQDEIKDRCIDIIYDTDLTVDEIIDKLFDILVPSSGKCNTEAGELIRAINRIRYRYNNDGDYFYTGYGLETCAPCIAYIIDTVGDYEGISDKFDFIKNKELVDTQYINKINKIANQILFYLADYDSVFYTTPIGDCVKYSSYTLEKIINADRCHTYDADTSDLQYYVDEGLISREDIVEYFLSDLCFSYGGDIEYSNYGYHIENLSGSELEQWEEMYPKELNTYIEQLEEEFAED